jgi:vesicle coat complex subunit
MATIQKELRSLKPEVQKNAIKRVVAGMTIGTDMSILFADVVNLMQSNDLELKKMVYLYTMKYAKANPDLAILAINTFKKDTRDPNPLIRALAVRTMGCLHLEKIAEYLCDPLQRCLKDEDPYVKKTAAVCVAKLYAITPELVEIQGFVDTLRDLVNDENPMVVANTVAVLTEIEQAQGTKILRITTSILQKLIAALSDCTWCSSAKRENMNDPAFSFFSQECQLNHSYHLYHSFISQENDSNSNAQTHTQILRKLNSRFALEHRYGVGTDLHFGSTCGLRTQEHTRGGFDRGTCDSETETRQLCCGTFCH